MKGRILDMKEKRNEEMTFQRFVQLYAKRVRWLRSFGQFFRFDKWNVCQGQTAKRTGGKLCAP